MRRLILNLKKEWYDKIASGECKRKAKAEFEQECEVTDLLGEEVAK